MTDGTPDSMVHAAGLRKVHPGSRGRDGLVAVDGIDFDVRPGEAFGFLGPNGAGKSTTMRMISCVSPPSGGVLRVLGLDPVVSGSAIRERVGVVPQDNTLDVELTVRENMWIYGRYFGLPRREVRRRAERLLEFMRLTEKSADGLDTLSGGMRRRLTIARSLINDPRLLLLDEPTTGLDPQARHALWERLFQLKRTGMTLILTTHYMDEAEQLLDRLVVMNSGRIVAEGSPAGLIARYSTREVLELRAAPLAERDLAGKIDGVADRVEVLADRLLLYTDDGDAALAEVRRRGIEPDSALVRRSTLEDVFLRLTGRALTD